MMGRMWLCIALTFLSGGAVSGENDRPRIRLAMITGGEVAGPLISFTDELVVLEVDGFPCAIAFDQVTADSACRVNRKLHIRLRGGRDRLEAADHYALGRFALRHDRFALARHEFAEAKRLDASYRKKVAAALERPKNDWQDAAPKVGPRAKDIHTAAFTSLVPEPFPPALPAGPSIGASGLEIERSRKRIIARYKAIGEQIREEVGSDLVLLETPHFLIWTDWAKTEHQALRVWCEATYTVVSQQFGMSGQVNIFPGKCPVFCMRSKRRFRKVAMLLDDYDAVDALGYTSVSRNGHVHVVVRRQGGSMAGRDAFAATLIHETTHAFLHRYRSGRGLPSWLNEGLANFVAEAVLGDRCPNAETAAAAAGAIVEGGYGIKSIFANDVPLDARYYPVAHSLVAFLIGRDAGAFSRLIDDIKLGQRPEEALEKQYHWSLAMLETQWRAAHRSDRSY